MTKLPGQGQEPPLTVDRLEDFLWQAAERVRGEVSIPEFPRIIGPLLLLKRASDQPDFLSLPEDARWGVVMDHRWGHLGDFEEGVNRTLVAFERHNPGLRDLFREVDFNGVTQNRRHALRQLIDMVGELSLSDDDLEFDDVVGRAFDRLLIRTASAQGAKGSESFTPRAVCRLMAELVDPQPGQWIADPHAGSGGMLLSAARYVSEHGDNQANLALVGQEKNSTAWLTGRLNLLLHGFTDAAVSHSDALTDPLEAAFSELSRFDRVLTSPPFSMNYDRHAIRHPERMKYGWVPEGGKKADLMFVQHVLSILRPDGTGAVVVPQGVLFRGGAERDIRRGLIEDNRLEAVIGIGANVFYNTGIPACILVLKGPHDLPRERHGTVLFINAEREVTVGRSRNRLDAEHIAKIVDAFLGRHDVPDFARVVSLAELTENDFNLNIRRYVDAAPPAEPLLDIGAALTGGVPLREIESQADLFHAFGVSLDDLFLPDRPGYRRFPSSGYMATATRIPELAMAQEQYFLDGVRAWWTGQRELVSDLAHVGLAPADVRSQLEASLCLEQLRSGILDRYQLLGAVASWWSDHEDDLDALARYGFPGVLRRWRSLPRDRAGTPRPPKHLLPAEEAHFVLDVLGDGLRLRVAHLVTDERQKLVDTYLRWGERYGTSMEDLEDRYRRAANRLRERMAALGHS
ncbi:class I SAM-dependent DNA methyltransferase [Streptomyces sp. MBT53]|uniref:type I restriction-modification system subunit M n=1 Tax=Streptomyces sp. MBT53 TaxID=1488384 RepID=UPI001913BA2E|nr:class I SAM-dependent DNA methyltransferase [Streptomyces sp. MBT53]MBK6014001.1 SAM-dependent DNA methyltransferase [Streptomyces sp. MBT53]